MHPEDKALLIKELGCISSEITRLQVQGEERSVALEMRLRHLHERLAKLEKTAEDTGRHELAEVQSEVRKRDEIIERWKGRGWSILAVLITSTIVFLVTYFFGHR